MLTDKSIIKVMHLTVFCNCFTLVSHCTSWYHLEHELHGSRPVTNYALKFATYLRDEKCPLAVLLNKKMSVSHWSSAMCL